MIPAPDAVSVAQVRSAFRGAAAASRSERRGDNVMKQQTSMLRADPARGTSPNVNLRAILWVLVWWAGGLVVAGPVALLALFATQSDARTAAAFSAILIPAAVLVVFVLRMAFRETVRLVRYRSLLLRLETCPAVLGGRLSNAVAGATGVLQEAMSFRLVCRSLAGGEGDDHLLAHCCLSASPCHRPAGPAVATNPELCGRSFTP